jgi:monofunctional biosynthetic peptidoglycan transglycosylase
MVAIRIFKGFASTTGLIVFLLVASVVAWFLPWVPVLHLGILAYFPYEKDGKERFLRVTGPVVGLVSDRWVSRTEIPRACFTALVASEDTRFYEHSGVDFESLRASYQYNKRRKKIRRGGSTITQQLVKNAFLSRERSYVRKSREFVGAMFLDVIMQKDSQLAWYFNIVEFGPGVYGIQDASKFYFKKKAKDLSPSQCIALVAVLPSPTKWGSSLAKKSFSSFLQSRYRTILSRMTLMGLTPHRDVAFARTHSPLWGALPLAAVPVVKEAAADGASAASAFEDASDAAVESAENERDALPPPPMELQGDGNQVEEPSERLEESVEKPFGGNLDEELEEASEAIPEMPQNLSSPATPGNLTQ